MTVFEHPEFNGHQQIHFFENKKVGLRAIIAIHHLIEGISGGGCRFYPYPTTREALTDVLRLSRAMTYKFVLAGIPRGGAKSVIIGNPKTDKTAALLEAFGRTVESLGGQYTTAGDVGTNEEDMLIIKRTTSYVVGEKGAAGDTSRITGYGVFQSIRAAVKYRLGKDSLQGIRVAVQGAGGVGQHLIQHLLKAGAQIILADIDSAALELAKQKGVTKIVESDKILFQEVEVLAPCALGGVLNENTIPKIKAKIIAGGANNQLAKEADAALIKQQNILLVPDFIANSGGVIQGTGYIAGKAEEAVIAHANTIYDTTIKVLEISQTQNITPLVAAYQLAEKAMEQ